MNDGRRKGDLARTRWWRRGRRRGRFGGRRGRKVAHAEGAELETVELSGEVLLLLLLPLLDRLRLSPTPYALEQLLHPPLRRDIVLGTCRPRSRPRNLDNSGAMDDDAQVSVAQDTAAWRYLAGSRGEAIPDVAGRGCRRV